MGEQQIWRKAWWAEEQQDQFSPTNLWLAVWRWEGVEQQRHLLHHLQLCLPPLQCNESHREGRSGGETQQKPGNILVSFQCSRGDPKNQEKIQNNSRKNNKKKSEKCLKELRNSGVIDIMQSQVEPFKDITIPNFDLALT